MKREQYIGLAIFLVVLFFFALMMSQPRDRREKLGDLTLDDGRSCEVFSHVRVIVCPARKPRW